MHDLKIKGRKTTAAFLLGFAGLFGLTTVAALPVSQAQAQTAPRHRPVSAGSIRSVHATLRFANPRDDAGAGHRNTVRFARLVGDRESGLGFYALPGHYRIIGSPDHRGEAIRYAVASEAGYGYDDVFANDATYGGYRRHGMFNRVDGYGTPFFAGYYGPAGDPGNERGPFGNPYQN